jgi:hypothetical protein
MAITPQVDEPGGVRTEDDSSVTEPSAESDQALRAEEYNLDPAYGLTWPVQDQLEAVLTCIDGSGVWISGVLSRWRTSARGEQA